MVTDPVFPLRMGLSRKAQAAEQERVQEVAVLALLQFLEARTGDQYEVTGHPDEEKRNERAPDREVRNRSSGDLIGLELVDDFSWDERQAFQRVLTELREKGSVELPVEDPRSSLRRVIDAKHKKGQLNGYRVGKRILLIGLARHGAAVLGVDKVGIPALSKSVTYMDQFPGIDHVFLWWLNSDGVQVEHIWSRDSLP